MYFTNFSLPENYLEGIHILHTVSHQWTCSRRAAWIPPVLLYKRDGVGFFVCRCKNLCPWWNNPSGRTYLLFAGPLWRQHCLNEDIPRPLQQLQAGVLQPPGRRTIWSRQGGCQQYGILRWLRDSTWCSHQRVDFHSHSWWRFTMEWFRESHSAVVIGGRGNPIVLGGCYRPLWPRANWPFR